MQGELIYLEQVGRGATSAVLQDEGKAREGQKELGRQITHNREGRGTSGEGLREPTPRHLLSTSRQSMLFITQQVFYTTPIGWCYNHIIRIYLSVF